MSSAPGPALGVREAAERCGVSTDTIRRRLRSGDFPRAERDDKQAWHIPIADLVAAGLNVSMPNSISERVELAAPDGALAKAHERIHQLELELARAGAAIEVAAAREAHINDLRAQVADLRALAGLPAV